MKKLIKNPKFIIPSVIVLLLLLVVAGSYAFYETDILNTFTRKVNITGSTEEMKAVSITSSTNSILLNLTKDQLSLPAGSILYGVSSGTASEEATNVELGTLTTDSGAASCDITMTVTFGNKDLINALVSTNELELNIGGVTTDLYSKKGVSSFNVLVEDFYVDTDGETLDGNLMYHILSGSQESEKGKSAGLTINYSSMTCSPTEEKVYYAFGDPTTSSPKTPPAGKNVYVALYLRGEKAVCINRNGTQHCFKSNNVEVEQVHVQEVFSDISCYVFSSYVSCDVSDFYCRVGSNGHVHCRDNGSREYCTVGFDGSVVCS